MIDHFQGIFSLLKYYKMLDSLIKKVLKMMKDKLIHRLFYG